MMLYAASTPKQAADIVLNNPAPLEIQIPRQARVSSYMGQIRIYCHTNGYKVKTANASIDGVQIVYVQSLTCKNHPESKLDEYNKCLECLDAGRMAAVYG